MNEAFTFDDVLIVPQFSDVASRKDVDLSFNEWEYPYLSLPIISANMDTVTGSEMAKAMISNGAMGCLHRFCSIDENVKMFKDSCLYGTGEDFRAPYVSIGLGNNELDRARALFDNGAYLFMIDVANGASMDVVKQVKSLHSTLLDNAHIMVGNFANSRSVKDFIWHVGQLVYGLKVGIGPGSACTTRIKTGVGYPQLSAVKEISEALKDVGIPVIADGGMKNSGDVAKALGAGASMVMSGSFFAGTDESPGEIVTLKIPKLDSRWLDLSEDKLFKKYRGSASQESYEAQNKTGTHRTAEGESFLVPYKGPVKNVLQDIEGGLRSAFSYVGARNLKEFHEKCEFVKISASAVRENGAHGKQ